mmetsp:Transcript_4776/g.20434  ORF Transcript_4776/g.20434 Transcript_4776/m.20434 type:complete len:233 (-) Transcript_4776:704-1402(-)
MARPRHRLPPDTVPARRQQMPPAAASFQVQGRGLAGFGPGRGPGGWKSLERCRGWAWVSRLGQCCQQAQAHLPTRTATMPFACGPQLLSLSLWAAAGRAQGHRGMAPAAGVQSGRLLRSGRAAVQQKPSQLRLQRRGNSVVSCAQWNRMLSRAQQSRGGLHPQPASHALRTVFQTLPQPDPCQCCLRAPAPSWVVCCRGSPARAAPQHAWLQLPPRCIRGTIRTTATKSSLR